VSPASTARSPAIRRGAGASAAWALARWLDLQPKGADIPVCALGPAAAASKLLPKGQVAPPCCEAPGPRPRAAALHQPITPRNRRPPRPPAPVPGRKQSRAQATHAWAGLSAPAPVLPSPAGAATTTLARGIRHRPHAPPAAGGCAFRTKPAPDPTTTRTRSSARL